MESGDCYNVIVSKCQTVIMVSAGVRMDGRIMLNVSNLREVLPLFITGSDRQRVGPLAVACKFRSLVFNACCFCLLVEMYVKFTLYSTQKAS